MAPKEFKPHEYQRLAIEHQLNTPRNALWAGMGMGKTSATLTTVDALYNVYGETRPTLVVAPLRVARSTWPDEVRKWTHLASLEVSPIVGTEAERLAALRNPNANVFTVNYENLPWLVEVLDGRWPFANVVLDESTKLKGWRGSVQESKTGKEFVRGTTGVRAKALAKVIHKHTERVMLLTGTPSPNGLADLWGQLWFLDAGLRLGRTYGAFESRWFFKQKQHPNDRYGIQVAHSFAQEQIQERLKDLCLTLDPADWFDLEEPRFVTVEVELPQRARALYQDMEREMFMQIDEHEVEAFNAAAKTVKCLQLANGAAYVGEDNAQWKEVHDVKLQALESIVEEAGGAPLLVAYNFKSDLARLKKAFPKHTMIADDDGKAFKTGRYPVGFAHPASVGHGIDGLQEVCHQVVFFGHWWNLEERMQMIERVGPTRQHQAGFKRTVDVFDIVAKDTVDELVLTRHKTKARVQDILLDAMKRRK